MTRIDAQDRIGEQVSPQRRIEERRSFLFLTAVMVPALTVMLIVGYGFAVWVYQMFAGPPTGT